MGISEWGMGISEWRIGEMDNGKWVLFCNGVFSKKPTTHPIFHPSFPSGIFKNCLTVKN